MASSPELTSVEKNLFKYVLECNFEEVKRLLTVENACVNCFDEDGMTPLQHAAYKGDYNMCKLLLDCGADVNLTRHTSQYSSLTFAGLTGKIDIVSLLLEHGASTTKLNSINKTAAQMAAFVGNHHVVNIINNFIPIEEIEDVASKVKGLESVCTYMHKMAIMTNIHPVRLVMYMQENVCILENAKKVKEVFDILCEKQLKYDGNELLSLKFHHLAFIINTCKTFIDEHKSKSSESAEINPIAILNLLIKYWIKGDENGFPIVLEKLLRQDTKEYPYRECSLFQELIRTLAPVKIGEECSAITIITQVTNGQRGTDNAICCATCGEPSAEKKCSGCKSVYYCNKDCQKLHWFTHKIVCPKLLKKHQEIESEVKPAESQTEISSECNEECKAGNSKTS